MDAKENHSKHDKILKITLNNGEYNCRVLGNGIKNIIAFHGFGQDGNAFLPFIKRNPGFTIYAIDLPFHGNTRIQEVSVCLSPHEIGELIQKLIEQTFIERFSLLGFSIGSRLVFPILKELHGQIEGIWLLAPDGIRINFWYRLATGTGIMRYIFRKTLRDSEGLEKMGKWLQALGILDHRTMLFAIKSIETKEKREQVYETWNYLRRLRIASDEISSLVNNHDIPIWFVLGNHDKIITKSGIEPLYSKVLNSKIIELECGHQNLIEHFAGWYESNYA